MHDRIKTNTEAELREEVRRLNDIGRKRGLSYEQEAKLKQYNTILREAEEERLEWKLTKAKTKTTTTEEKVAHEPQANNEPESAAIPRSEEKAQIVHEAAGISKTLDAEILRQLDSDLSWTITWYEVRSAIFKKSLVQETARRNLSKLIKQTCELAKLLGDNVWIVQEWIDATIEAPEEPRKLPACSAAICELLVEVRETAALAGLRQHMSRTEITIAPAREGLIIDLAKIYEGLYPPHEANVSWLTEIEKYGGSFFRFANTAVDQYGDKNLKCPGGSTIWKVLDRWRQG